MGVTLTMRMSDTWINATRTCRDAGGLLWHEVSVPRCPSYGAFRMYCGRRMTTTWSRWGESIKVQASRSSEIALVHSAWTQASGIRR